MLVSPLTFRELPELRIVEGNRFSLVHKQDSKFSKSFLPISRGLNRPRFFMHPCQTKAFNSQNTFSPP